MQVFYDDKLRRWRYIDGRFAPDPFGAGADSRAEQQVRQTVSEVVREYEKGYLSAKQLEQIIRNIARREIAKDADRAGTFFSLLLLGIIICLASSQVWFGRSQQLAADTTSDATAIANGSASTPGELPTEPPCFQKPAEAIFTSDRKWRWGRQHHGIDLAGPVGTPIVSATAGRVIAASDKGDGYGNKVEIQITQEDAEGQKDVLLYGHNSRVFVQEGDWVEPGDPIAEMGSTGYSTGPHLHFEWRPAGERSRDPKPQFCGGWPYGAEN